MTFSPSKGFFEWNLIDLRLIASCAADFGIMSSNQLSSTIIWHFLIFCERQVFLSNSAGRPYTSSLSIWSDDKVWLRTMELIWSHEWDVKMTIWREKSEWRIGAGRWWRCVKSEVVNQWERSGDKVAPIRTWIFRPEVSISNEVKVRVYTMSLSPQEVLIYSHKRTQNNLLCIMSAKYKLIIEILTPLLGRHGMRWKLKRAFLVEGGNMWTKAGLKVMTMTMSLHWEYGRRLSI